MQARPHLSGSLQGNITGVGKGVLVITTTHMYVEADTDLSCDFFALRDKIQRWILYGGAENI